MRRIVYLSNAEDNNLEDVLGKVRRCPHAVDVHMLQHRPQHGPANIHICLEKNWENLYFNNPKKRADHQ